AKVPGWFSRGTRRPLPAGRAFLALLACASERLSASRFAEYLSFAQVPVGGQNADTSWAASQDESFGRVRPPIETNEDASVNGEESLAFEPESSPEPRVPSPEPRAPGPESSDSVLAGTLRAPWRWEALIVDAAVIGRDAV